MRSAGRGVAWWWRRARVHVGILLVQGVVVAAAVVIVGVVLGTVGRGTAAGVRDYLAALDDADRTLTLATSPAADPDGQAAGARAVVAATLPGDHVDLWRRVLSGAYRAGGGALPAGTTIRLATAAGLRDHAALTAGRWPTAGDGSGDVEVALPADRAAAWRAGPGTRLQLTATSGIERTAVVTGTIAPDDSGFWAAPVALVPGDRTTDASPWALVDPAVLDPAVLDPAGGDRGGDGALAAQQVSWTVVPRVGTLTSADLAELSTAVAALPAAVRADPAIDQDGTLQAGRLPDSLATAAAAVTAATGATVVPLLLVALFCLVMLVQLGRLLVDDRRPETALLLSRGLSARRLAGWTALEVGVPAVLGAALGTALALPWGLGRATAVTAAAGVVVAVVAAALPAWRAGRAGVRRDRIDDAGRRTTLVTGGLALALTALAAFSWWRSRRPGAADDDPFVAATPALVLLAAGVLAVLLHGLLAAVAARRAARRAALSPVLPARQVARRGAVFGAAVLLLALAVGGGVLAAGYAATVQRLVERTDRALVGPDVRVADALPVGVTLTGVLDAVAATPGVTAATPVSQVAAGSSDNPVDIAAIPSGRLTALLPDVGGRATAEVAAALPAGATAAPQVPQGDGAVRLEISVRGAGPVSVSAAVRWLLPTGALVTTSVTLTGTEGELRAAAPLTPPPGARLAAVDVTVPLDAADRSLVIGQQVAAPGGAVLSDTRWPTVVLGDVPGTVAGGDGQPVRLAVPGGATGTSTLRWLAPGSTGVDDPIPVVVPQATATALGLAVGDRLSLRPQGGQVPVVVAAVVPYLPGFTADPSPTDTAPTGTAPTGTAPTGSAPTGSATTGPAPAAVVLADLGALDLRLLQVVTDPTGPSEIWAAASDPGTARTALTRVLTGGATVSAVGAGASLTGIAVRALVLGAIGATLLAIAAAVLVATTLEHRRRPEVPVLAALGVPAGAQAAMRRRELLTTFLTGWVLGLPAGAAAVVAAVPGLAERAAGRRVVPPELLADPVLLAVLLLPVVPALVLVGAAAAGRVHRRARRPDLREVVP